MTGWLAGSNQSAESSTRNACDGFSQPIDGTPEFRTHSLTHTHGSRGKVACIGPVHSDLHTILGGLAPHAAHTDTATKCTVCFLSAEEKALQALCLLVDHPRS